MSNFTEKEQQAALFLSELAKGIPDEQRVMVGYSSEATSQKGKNGKMNNSGWKPLPHRIDREIEVRKNCYVCISASIKTPHPFYEGAFRYWRGEDSFGNGLCLMVDDIGNGTGSKGGLTLEWFKNILPPTVIVETSPNNHQLWYFLNAPCPNMAYFKAFLVSFAEQVLDKGGDHTIRDVSRYGRLPCGINNKKKPDSDELKYWTENGKPFQVRLVSADYDRRYSIERICAAFNMRVVMPRTTPRLPLAEKTAADELPIDYKWLGLLVRELSRMKQGEYSGGEVRKNASGRYRIRCPYSHLHSSHDAYGAYFRGPVSGGEFDFIAGCSHDTCRNQFKWGWNALVDLILITPFASFLSDCNAFYASKDFQFYKSVFL